MTYHELTPQEKREMNYIADKYMPDLRFDLDGKVGAVFEGAFFPSAMMGDIQENGYQIQEVREGENRPVEMVVHPTGETSWASDHERPLPTE